MGPTQNEPESLDLSLKLDHIVAARSILTCWASMRAPGSHSPETDSTLFLLLRMCAL
jgi:hypothetical protein